MFVNKQPAGNGRRTALHCAAQEGHLDIVRQLLKVEANALLKTDNGETAKQLAEARSDSPAHRAVAAALLEAELKRNGQRRRSETGNLRPKHENQGSSHAR